MAQRMRPKHQAIDVKSGDYHIVIDCRRSSLALFSVIHIFAHNDPFRSSKERQMSSHDRLPHSSLVIESVRNNQGWFKMWQGNVTRL